jgi:hypothetical protein
VAVEIDDPASLGIMFYVYTPQINKYQKGSAVDSGLSILSWYLSGSMEPAFHRGDLLFLTNPSSEQYRTGVITIYHIPGVDIAIVHRVLESHDVPPTIDIRQYNRSTTQSEPSANVDSSEQYDQMFKPLQSLVNHDVAHTISVSFRQQHCIS